MSFRPSVEEINEDPDPRGAPPLLFSNHILQDSDDPDLPLTFTMQVRIGASPHTLRPRPRLQVRHIPASQTLRCRLRIPPVKRSTLFSTQLQYSLELYLTLETVDWMWAKAQARLPHLFQCRVADICKPPAPSATALGKRRQREYSPDPPERAHEYSYRPDADDHAMSGVIRDNSGCWNATMSSRAALYQMKLTGYFRVRAQPILGDDIVSPYHADEGQQWWPINVDSGSRSDPIDVEWWTYLCPLDGRRPDGREAQDESRLHILWRLSGLGRLEPESDSVPAVPGLEQSPLVDNKVFDCGICWDTLYKPCLHKWLGDKKDLSPVYTRIKGTAHLRLRFPIIDGRVAKVDGERVTLSAYEWMGVDFVSAKGVSLV
ncbi:hypothetical protein B0H14DRAFT_3498195 [Mycena olivaceomarginata]|nr:hypothetical protein B0H14DRAFT_3498195 [Mycena olivaceomarginata]